MTMNLKLIKFLKEDLALRHARTGGKYIIVINGKKMTKENIEDIVTTIIGSANSFKNNVNWQEFKSWLQSELKDDEDLFDVMPEVIKEHVMTVLSNKTVASTKIHQNVEAYALNSFTKELPELPKIGFNTVDKKIMKRFRYCAEDTCIYIKKNKKLKLIGKLELLKRDQTEAGICKFVKEEIGKEWNEGVPMPISQYVSECFSNTTTLRHSLISDIRKHLDAGEDVKDISIKITDDEVFTLGNIMTDDINAIENAVHNYCIEMLWKILPCSLFTAKIVVLKALFNTYEMPKSEGGTYKQNEFVKYTYEMVRSGDALTEAAYLKNIFTTYAAELKDDSDFALESAPRTYADNGVENTLFNYDEDLLKESLKGLGCYRSFDECDNLTLLKSWMNEDEFRFAMAWAYAAIHPCSVKSNIALLLWTGGGTGKSSFVTMIKYALMMVSGGHEEDLYFEIKGDKFLDDDKNWQPDGRVGLPKAALVNIDEATTECIETYKNFSGSADKNILALRLNYENTINYDVKGKFIFTTNKGLQLSSDDGSLLRRVAVIKHTGIQNKIGQKPKTNEEIVLEYKKQIPMLLAVGKKSLDEILKMGYESLDAYAMKCENITKNLAESTASSANTEIYTQMWERLESNWKDHKQDDGSYRLRGNALKRLYFEICEMNGEDARYFSNFKKFILERGALFENENKKKAARSFIAWDDVNDYTFHKENSDCIYIIYRMKDDKKISEE